MLGKGLSPSSKVWFGFFAVALLLGMLLLMSQLFGGSPEKSGRLSDALRGKGEALEDCLLRVQQDNPSYSSDLVERLCRGR
jgi:hypothetical protein